MTAVSAIWAKAHGATTHFPIALALCSFALDAAGRACARKPIERDLHLAACWTMICGGLGTVPAVMSGILMTQGIVMGHDALRLHHVFVWPAFGLLVGLGTWRFLQRNRSPGHGFSACYLVLASFAAALLSIAAYWGGKMMVSR